MSVILFIFQICNVILIILTTTMLQNKFTKIEFSLSGYCNRRIYTTEQDNEFIKSIIDKYNLLCRNMEEEPNVENIIVRKLQHELVGRFTYISVKNLALKGKNLMWAVLMVQSLIIILNHSFGNIREIILLNSNILITLMMTFYVILKDIEDKEKVLMDNIIYYVQYEYKEAIKQSIKKEEIMHRQQVKQETEEKQETILDVSKEQLTSTDIARLLSSI